MKELNIDFQEENQHLFPEVLQKFHKISRLSLFLIIDNEKSIFNAFKETPVLQNLIEIKYYPKSYEIAKQFLDSLKQMENKLPKLKSI